MSFKSLIDDNNGVVIINKDIIDIRNYQDIISFDDNKSHTIESYMVKLLKQEELVLSGNINNIEYR